MSFLQELKRSDNFLCEQKYICDATCKDQALFAKIGFRIILLSKGGSLAFFGQIHESRISPH